MTDSDAGPLLTTLDISQSRFGAELLPRVRGRVFHSTTLAAAQGILQSGAILPNKEKERPSGFGIHYNALFRSLDAVSLFDFRAATDEELEDCFMKCSPWKIGYGTSGFAIFVLKPSVCEGLLSWKLWKEEPHKPKMVVPYVEAGHTGPISLDAVEEIILVRTLPDPGPPDPFLEAHLARPPR